MKLRIDHQLINTSQEKLALGVIISEVHVQEKNEALWNMIELFSNNLKTMYASADVPEILALQDTYTNLGLDKSEYIGSNENLLKTIISGECITQRNNIVDINNYVSLESGRAISSYDLEKICGTEIIFRPGEPEDEYQTLNGQLTKLNRLPILTDNIGAFGSASTNSSRTEVLLDTKYVMTVIFSFDGQESLSTQLERTARYLEEYASARILCTHIVLNESEFSYELSNSHEILSDKLLENNNRYNFFNHIPPAITNSLTYESSPSST